MRILIITHARSGGKSLLNWITKEKNFLGFHEPNINDKDILNKIIKTDNIVVKLFPTMLMDEKISIKGFVKTFNKIICHHRDNIRDVAISMVHGNEVDNPNHDNWHKPYDITPEWLIDNKDKINAKLQFVNKMIEMLSNLKIDCLTTTYEGIYESKTDIDKLIKFLEISSPFYLDLLDKRHRLRGGDIDENEYIKSKTII